MRCGFLGVPQRGERFSLGCQGRPVAGILRQHIVGNLQGDLWRATLQRVISHVEPWRPRSHPGNPTRGTGAQHDQQTDGDAPNHRIGHRIC